MAKNRYILCLLASAAMLYFALPRLPIHDGGLAGVFAISWLILCLIVIAGNLSALLYEPKKARENVRKSPVKSQKRLRSYN
ncbi:hypothetical protein [Robertmurraya siralis]|uniref:hypothetical protein n=1 Tax=Robertmurraya siralis TaxID=77777 RepID=UPI0010F5AD43|nr:hypothetical protein [Robertmurraya siralis]